MNGLRKSNRGLKLSGSILSLVLLFVVGLLLLSRRFLNGTPQKIIVSTLEGAGYSSDFAKWWVAISDHETGKWTSDLYKKYNNLFGMTQPKVRDTTSIGPVVANDRGTKTEFASFRNIDDSVKDLLLYLKEWNYPKTFSSVDDLVSFMKSKGYFTDSVANYSNSVKARL